MLTVWPEAGSAVVVSALRRGRGGPCVLNNERAALNAIASALAGGMPLLRARRMNTGQCG